MRLFDKLVNMTWSEFVFFTSINEEAKQLCQSDEVWLARLNNKDPLLTQYKPTNMSFKEYCTEIEFMYMSLALLEEPITLSVLFNEAIYRKPMLVPYFLAKGAKPNQELFDAVVQNGDLELVKLFYEMLNGKVRNYTAQYNNHLRIKHGPVAQFLMDHNLFKPTQEYVNDVAYYNKSSDILDWALEQKIKPDENTVIKALKRGGCDRTENWIKNHLNLYSDQVKEISV